MDKLKRDAEKSMAEREECQEMRVLNIRLSAELRKFEGNGQDLCHNPKDMRKTMDTLEVYIGDWANRNAVAIEDLADDDLAVVLKTMKERKIISDGAFLNDVKLKKDSIWLLLQAWTIDIIYTRIYNNPFWLFDHLMKILSPETSPPIAQGLQVLFKSFEQWAGDKNRDLNDCRAGILRLMNPHPIKSTVPGKLLALMDKVEAARKAGIEEFAREIPPMVSILLKKTEPGNEDKHLPILRHATADIAPIAWGPRNFTSFAPEVQRYRPAAWGIRSQANEWTSRNPCKRSVPRDGLR
ncbi:hypothetical protein EJ08DRAFT_738373 [Tothia fuscella]|uniref:Uncharacterized protein n=1 Tax=Tothia fuscella TaxID=1048955 RepID=A0A9P4NGX7_9PEZI|nr:hypothetical protein EJ08DRAFT_738373 [Tothia fuscella]